MDVHATLGRIEALLERTHSDVLELKACVSTQKEDIVRLKVETNIHRTWFKLAGGVTAALGLGGGGLAGLLQLLGK